MKLLHLVALTCCLFSCSTARNSDERILPVYYAFKGIETQNFEMFKHSFSKKYRSQFTQEIFNGYLQLFGNYKLDQFKYKFEGNGKKGIVIFSPNNKAFGDQELDVIKENGSWKINEF